MTKINIQNYFSNTNNYTKLSDTSLWLSGSHDMQSLFDEITTRFIEKNQTLVEDYLDRGEQNDHNDNINTGQDDSSFPGFQDLIRSYINFIVNEGYVIEREKLLSSLSHGDSITDSVLFDHIKNVLKNRTNKTNINLLGFGSDTCIYEKKLAQFIIENHLASKVTIYSYDPYSERKTEDVIFINEDDIAKNIDLKFDLIISRWVLHHVAAEFRWDTFAHFANACNEDALILVLEEGDLGYEDGNPAFYQRKLGQKSLGFESIQSRIYEFFLACIDIFVNFGLRPQWFLSSNPIGENFYVKYLNHQDVVNIEKAFQFEYAKNIIPISDGNSYGQYILSYERFKPGPAESFL